MIESIYNDAEVFSADGLAPVKDKSWGFINTSGKLVIPTQYGISAGGVFSKFKEINKKINMLVFSYCDYKEEIVRV